LTGIQLISVAFAVGMMYQTYIHYRRRDLRVGEFALWITLWLALLIVSLLPGPLQQFVGIFKVARLLDLVTTVGMLVIGAVTYRLFLETRRLQRAVDALIRERALDDVPPTPPR
jgi:hypothetical protein